jgi:LPS export ABC transporter protein LptC
MNKFILLYLFSILIFECKKVQSLRIENEKESGSTITLRNFKRDGFNEKGELQWKLNAEEAFVYVKENKSIFYKVDFDQYDKGKIKSEVKSDRAEIDQGNKKLTLFGNVDLLTEDKKHLQTEELQYDLNDEKLFTNKEVKIQLKGTTIEGEGLEADKGLNSIKILKPKAVSSENPLEKK